MNDDDSIPADRLPEKLAPRYRELQAVIRRHGSMAVAYSGGVDSAFLAVAARQTLGDAHPATIRMIDEYNRIKRAPASPRDDSQE